MTKSAKVSEKLVSPGLPGLPGSYAPDYRKYYGKYINKYYLPVNNVTLNSLIIRQGLADVCEFIWKKQHYLLIHEYCKL